MKKTLTLLVKLLLTTGITFVVVAEAQASRCTVDCRAKFRDTVDSIDSTSSAEIHDFKANCTQYHKGSWSCYSSQKCTCIKEYWLSNSGYGWGDDIAEARAEARSNCSRGFEGSVMLLHNNYECTP